MRRDVSPAFLKVFYCSGLVFAGSDSKVNKLVGRYYHFNYSQFGSLVGGAKQLRIQMISLLDHILLIKGDASRLISVLALQLFVETLRRADRRPLVLFSTVKHGEGNAQILIFECMYVPIQGHPCAPHEEQKALQ